MKRHMPGLARERAIRLPLAKIRWAVAYEKCQTHVGSELLPALTRITHLIAEG